MKKIYTLALIISLCIPGVSFAQNEFLNNSTDTALKVILLNLNSQVETFYNQKDSYKNVCKDSEVKNVLSDVKKYTKKKPKCVSNEESFVIASATKSSSKRFCMDINGISDLAWKHTSKDTVLTCEEHSEVSKEDHFLSGDINSKVKVVTYSSLADPFSRRFDKTIRDLSESYRDRVAFIFRHNPLGFIFQKADLAANATECIAHMSSEENFFSYVYDLFKAQDQIAGFKITEESLLDIAQNRYGMDKNKFKSCLSQKKYASKIKSDLKSIEGTELETGTPYSIVYGPKGTQKIIAGAQPYDAVKSVIEDLFSR